MKYEASNEFMNWADENHLEPRIRNFMIENAQYCGTVQLQLILDISKFLKLHEVVDEKVARCIQQVVSAYGKNEFAACLVDYLTKPPTKKEDETMENPTEQPQGKPQRKTYIKQDEVMDMVIDFNTIETEEEFQKLLETH